MRKLTLSLAVMAALMPLRGYSLGLGDLELSSALNQELNAEIEVTSATAEDAEQLIIKLAGRDAFTRAGLDRPFLLQQLKFKLIEKAGKPYVQVYTKTPIREPYLSFLLEVDWPQGHLLREYTLLLDPPVYDTGEVTSAQTTSFNQPAAVQAQTQPVYAQQQNAPATHSGAQAVSNVQSGVISSDSGRSVNYQYQELPVANASAEQYRVQKNDTLWGIANRMRPDSSVSVEQMMMALVRKNPEAFIRENINGVKRGYILRAPSREEATQINRQQAIAQAREHSALWREYSQSANRAAPASSLEADEMGGGNSAAEQARDADGHLSIVSASENGSDHAGSNQDPNAELNKIKQELAMANEQLESERLEKEELRSRLAELEQRVQSVIQMDDEQLAQLQQELTPQQAEVVTTEEALVEAEMQEPVTAEQDDVLETMPDVMEDEVSDAVMEAETQPAEVNPEISPDEEAIFVDETEEVVEEVVEVEAPAPVIDAIEPPAFAQKKSKGFVENLLDDPKLLGMIGGGVAFILLLIALLVRRLRGNKEEEWSSELDDPESMDLSDINAEMDTGLDAGLDDATVKTEAANFDSDSTAEMAAMADEDSLGMNDTQIDVPDDADDLDDTVIHLDDNESEPEEDDRDDVIAEADVYLAYGIYQQAEELLTSAIDQNPDRDDYRMKLLETHYASKNTTGFEQLAEDVKARGSDKPNWDRVVAMGMEICPDSALFSGENAVIADFDPEELLPDKPQTTDLELDAGDETTDFDLGLDDTELDLSEDNDADKTQMLSESLDLDSELDGMSLDDDINSDLELDLGSMDDSNELGLGSDNSDETAAGLSSESSDLDIDEDFSLDFDAADLGFEESEEDSLDADLDDTALDLGVDLEDSDEEIEIDLSEDLIGDLESSTDELDIDDVNPDDIDLGDMDLGDMDLGDADASEALDDMDLGELDLSESIDLDDDDQALDASVEGAALGETGESNETELTENADDEFDLSELSGEIDEVGTKLDLAKAYLDMGDNDGARSILEEVKAEGNEEQQKMADELIQQAS